MQIVKAVLITAIVMIISLLPPGIHFVTGPFGPAIGGYVSGSRLRLTGRESLLLGLVLALLSGVPAYFGLQSLATLSNSTTIVLAVLVSLYVGGLASVASWFASSSQEDEGPEGSEYSPAGDR